MPSTDPARPNILFILTDDQGPWAMGCAGNRELKTPNLDRLAATGMRFDHFFCTSPVSSPARASLMTGCIPSQHGVHDWLAAGDTVASEEPARGGKLIEYLADCPGYTDYLAKAGYVCGISGKWHMGDSHHPQKGFTYWNVHAKGGGPYYQAPMVDGDDVRKEPEYITDVFTDNALAFLEQQQASEQPFYLSVHYTAPHSPWGRDQHPKGIYDDYYENCPFESLPDGLTPPGWVRFQPLALPEDDGEARRARLSGYFAAITAMDRQVGRLIDYLEARGLRENKLIVFTADNGMNMGHHGVYGKGNATFPMNMFDESVKVPFIASQPGVIPQNEVASAMVSQYDFMPTLLEYAGVEGSGDDGLPGRSFSGVLRGGAPSAQPLSGGEYVVVFDEYGPVRMVRTREWKYVHRYPYGPHELYDLANDPGETTNLIDDAAHGQTVSKLRGQLCDWFTRYANLARDGARLAVTGSGQNGRCEEACEGYEPFSQGRVADLFREQHEPKA